jgi:hypothetical protein
MTICSQRQETALEYNPGLDGNGVQMRDASPPKGATIFILDQAERRA